MNDTGSLEQKRPEWLERLERLVEALPELVDGGFTDREKLRREHQRSEARRRFSEVYAAFVKVVIATRGRRINRTELLRAGLTAEALRESGTWDRRRVRRGRMTPGKVPAADKQRRPGPPTEGEVDTARVQLGLGAAGDNKERSGRAGILGAMADAMAPEAPEVSPFLVVDRKGGVVFTPQRRVRPEWIGCNTVVVLLDATAPAAWMIEAVLPEGRQLTIIEAQACWPENVHAVTRTGMPVTKRKLLKERARNGARAGEADAAARGAQENLARVRAEVGMRAVVAALMGQEPMMLASQKEIVLALTDAAPNIITTWFNRSRGSNAFEKVMFALSIGRTLPPPHEVEIMSGHLGEAVELTEGWYPKELAVVTLRDGTTVALTQERHPDDAAEAIRRTITEDEVRNGVVGRLRAVRRKEEVRIEIWDDRRHEIPLSDMIDCSHKASAGGWWAQAETGVLFHSPSVYAAVEWISRRAAKERLEVARSAWTRIIRELRPFTSWNGGPPVKPQCPGLVIAVFKLFDVTSGAQTCRNWVGATILPGEDGKPLDRAGVEERLRAVLEPRGLYAVDVTIGQIADPRDWRP